MTPWDVQSRRIYGADGKWPAIYAGEGGGHGYVMQEVEPGAFTLKIRSGCEGGGKGPLVQTEKSATLSTLQNQTLFVMQGNVIDRDIKQNGAGIVESETMFTLNATDRHGVCYLLNDQGGQSMAVEDGRVSPTLRAESHAHEPIICVAFVAGQGAKANGIGWAEEQAPTLRTDGGLSAMPTVLCRAHGQANAETLEECSPSLTCNHEQPIVFDARGNGDGKVVPTITGDHESRVTDYTAIVAFSKEAYNTGKNASCSLGIESGDVAPTMRADTHPAGIAYKILRWIVRRITPMECERLQGYPDGWTDIGEWLDTRGKRHKSADGPRYKALGNSIALPQWWWIICKMAAYLPTGATLGSLFDGIGGFPLVWEKRHGAGTALWASEIEEFPIAVTKRRFPES